MGEKPTANLSRAQWSNHSSQVLTGYADDGLWVETELVWWRGTDQYEGSDRVYRVVNWARSGADYGSREKSG